MKNLHLVMEYKKSERPILNISKDVAKMLQDIKDENQEMFVLLCLDSRNGLISRNIITIGGLNSSIVHPREIFKTAILNSANSIILAHNHPTGICDPSREDIKTTEVILKASKVMGINLLDHIIVGGNNHISMKEDGLVNFY